MSKKYKILLSAYACEPNKGSEPGVGWNWAFEIVKRGHEVWVLTRANNQSTIETYFAKNSKPENLHFIYYDVPKYLSWWKRGGHGVHLYYYLWQMGILSVAKKFHQKIDFDFVHHITFVTIHQPSFLFRLKNVPFFYGPCGGGDLVPKRFLKAFPLKKRVKENLLSLQNKLLVFDPLRRWMFRKSDLIFCNSNQTQSFLSQKVISKTKLNLAIGIASNGVENINTKQDSNFNLLYAGNLLHWKGLHLALEAFNIVSDQILAKYTIIGKGNIEEFDSYDSSKKEIEYISRIPQDQLLKLYQTYDLFLFPSFRDSGGMVVLEALEQGLPVICLDLGGPGQIVNETCGRVITTKGKSEKEVVTSISKAILELQQDPDLLNQLSEGAIRRAAEFTWEKTVARVYEEIETFMEHSN